MFSRLVVAVTRAMPRVPASEEPTPRTMPMLYSLIEFQPATSKRSFVAKTAGSM